MSIRNRSTYIIKGDTWLDASMVDVKVVSLVVEKDETLVEMLVVLRVDYLGYG